MLSGRVWERLGFGAESLARRCGQPGAASLSCLLLCKGLWLIFAHPKRSRIPTRPFIDVPPAHLVKDGFAGLWSSLCNTRASSPCVTLARAVAASSLAPTPRRIPLFPKENQYCYCYVLFIPWKNIERKMWEKISSFFLESVSSRKTKNIELKKPKNNPQLILEHVSSSQEPLIL